MSQSKSLSEETIRRKKRKGPKKVNQYSNFVMPRRVMITLRVLPGTRVRLNEIAAKNNLTLQNYCKEKLGIKSTFNNGFFDESV